MKKFFDCGIDLGTTNSCIAVPNNDNTCTIIESTTAPMQVTPSAVWVSKKGHITVGRKAYYCTNIGEVKKSSNVIWVRRQSIHSRVRRSNSLRKTCPPRF